MLRVLCDTSLLMVLLHLGLSWNTTDAADVRGSNIRLGLMLLKFLIWVGLHSYSVHCDDIALIRRTCIVIDRFLADLIRPVISRSLILVRAVIFLAASPA